jgi:hypothetical protein
MESHSIKTLKELVMARTRTRETFRSGGLAYKNKTKLATPDFVSVREFCIDEQLKGDGFPLHISKYAISGGTMNTHVFSTNDFGTFLKNYPVGHVKTRSESITGPAISTGSPSDSFVATQCVAKTNPSRPEMDLPTALFELREFPELFRSSGSKLLQKLAGANLKVEFGIKPLASDLAKLVMFADIVEKRFKELRRLQERGLRRTIRIGSYTHREVQLGVTVESLTYVVYCDITRVTREDVSAFVQWFPTSQIPTSDAALRALARKVAYGLTIDFSTAWNLIPWSWLIDWCTSTGDFFEATRNMVPSHHSKVQVMRQIRYESFSPKQSNSQWTMSEIRCKGEKKFRSLADPTPFSAHLPVLSGRQMSILGSIGLLSGKSR